MGAWRVVIGGIVAMAALGVGGVLALADRSRPSAPVVAPPPAPAASSPEPAPATPPAPRPAAATGGFYVDPDSAAARWVAEHPDDPRAEVIRQRVARVAQARWFTRPDTAGVRAEVDAYVGAAAAAGATPILVVYNVPNRDCGGASAGGMPSHEAYREWIDQVAAGLGGRPAAIVLEPDVLALMSDCLDKAGQARVRESVAYAVTRLKAGSAAAKVYVDAAHSHWLPPAEMAARLVAAGVREADGIATNVSNYRTTRDEVAYAKRVLTEIGVSRLRAVVDTSRNGNGPLGEEWCDPKGRAIGTPTTTATGDARIAAFLWVKPPGEADGCVAAAGRFVPERAYELATA